MKTITLFFTILISSLFSISQTPINGLIGYWPFTGNSNDFSGNNFNGTVNGATLTTDRFGQINSAYEFNGSSNIQINNFTDTSQTFTINLWFDAYTNGDPGTWEFLHRSDSISRFNAAWNMSWGRQNNSNYLHSILYTTTGNIVNLSDSNMTLNSWYMATITNDGDMKRIYVNGILIDSLATTGTTIDYTNKNLISIGFDSQINWFTGKIDDIRIYDRSLSDAEVTLLYNETPNSYSCIIGSLPVSIFQGLIAWYPFCGDAHDETEHGHNGILNGATLSTDRFGNLNSAYSFDGLNDSISIPNAPELNIQNGQSFSVALWMKSDTLNSAKYFLSKYSGVMGQGEAYAFGTQDVPNPGGLYSYFEHSSGYIEVRGITQVADTNWHQFAYVFHSGVGITTYVDGQIDTMIQSSFAGSITNNLDLSIGAGGLSQFFKGKLDDVRIYNRALDSTEVTALYNENICFQTVTVTDTLIINANLTGFNPVTYQNSIKIYPNPAYDHITIDNGSNYSTLAGYTLRIDNSLSQTVYSTVVNQQIYSIDLNSWTGNGVYFVYLINSTGHIVDVKKIVIQ